MGATTPLNFIQIEGPLPSSGRSFMDKVKNISLFFVTPKRVVIKIIYNLAYYNNGKKTVSLAISTNNKTTQLPTFNGALMFEEIPS